MHLISCRAHEQFLIGDSVRVTVLEVSDHTVRLGIATPGQFPEYREEIVEIAPSAVTGDNADDPATEVTPTKMINRIAEHFVGV